MFAPTVVEDVLHFLINEQVCTECLGDHAEAQCAAICPIEGRLSTNWANR